VVPGAASGQASDSLKPYTMPPIIVSVTRAEHALTQVPLAVQRLDRTQISRAKPTWGLDEALAQLPGVFVANRYNFAQDQRLSIRGFGARSAFAVRGIKILVDGIPQTLPDGQGQLTNLELGEVDGIEVLRGSSSALFGNASGGVISIRTRPLPVQGIYTEASFLGGRFNAQSGRTWNKWRSTSAVRIGGGSAQLTVSRLDYEGERDHSVADLRQVNARFQLPLGARWSLALVTAYGDTPRADNPGSLTLDELRTNRTAAPALNVARRAGKDVSQLQAGATVRHMMDNGGEAALTVFGLTRDLKNPLTTTYIDLERFDYGARASVTYPAAVGSLRQRLTAGVDFQQQRDRRRNFPYLTTPGDSATPDTAPALHQFEAVTEIGPFLQSALELSPQATLTAGLRYDWVRFAVDDHLVAPANPDDSGERVMNALSGSLGIAFNPSPGVTVYGNIGSSFETPTTTELANSATGAGGFNPDLKPQKAVSYEVGARGRLDRGGRLAYSVALFQADVGDALVPYELAAPRFYYRNAGSSRHRGVEVGGDLTMLPGVHLGASWTLSDYRYRRYSFVTGGVAHVLDGRALPGVPRHWLNMVLRAGKTSATGGTAFLGGFWAELQQTYSSALLVSDTLNTRTSPWWATNVRVGWEGEAGGMRLAPFLGVNNAFNHMYVSSVVINAARGRFYEPAPGRNVYLGLVVGAGR
jgi:iron complex outermembrane receptor protein